MSRKMYSPELKLEIIQRYLNNGESVTLLAREYHIGSRADIRKWISQYRENGISGLSVTHGTYTGEFKISVVEYIHTTGSSARAAAAHFNIPSPQTVNSWERIYHEQGKEALLEERRGKATKLGTKRPRKPKMTVGLNEELLAEVQRLRMENEYLKKLNALIQDREKSEKPTK